MNKGEKGRVVSEQEVFLLNGTQLTRLLDVVCLFVYLFVYYFGTLNQAQVNTWRLSLMNDQPLLGLF